VSPAFRRWLVEHDDRWSFLIPYVALAVVLSVFISLFWLVVVVAVHGLLEWIRQRQLRPDGPVLGAVLWETKLDIALVVFSLALAVYMEFIMGVAGLGGAARAGVRTGARFAGYERALRGVLLSADDAAQLARAAGSRLGRKKRGETEGATETEGEAETEGATATEGEGRWGAGDWFGLGLGVGCGALILVAPALVDVSYRGILAIFAQELHPWP
jgi:hypothetical protein